MHLNWRHLFDWTVVSATEPVAVKNKHGAIEGYEFEVQYVYHGKRKFYFDMDADMWYAQYGSPLAAARSFYAKYDAEAKEWQRKAAEICGVKKVKSR
jgi:hypothetical protein